MTTEKGPESEVKKAAEEPSQQKASAARMSESSSDGKMAKQVQDQNFRALDRKYLRIFTHCNHLNIYKQFYIWWNPNMAQLWNENNLLMEILFKKSLKMWQIYNSGLVFYPPKVFLKIPLVFQRRNQSKNLLTSKTERVSFFQSKDIYLLPSSLFVFLSETSIFTYFT